MNWLIKHPEQWKKFSENARKKVAEDFNVKIQLQKQKQFYDEIIMKK